MIDERCNVMKKKSQVILILFIILLIVFSIFAFFTGNPIKKIYYNFTVEEYLNRQYPYYKFENINTYYDWKQGTYYALSESVEFPQISTFKIFFKKRTDGEFYYTNNLCERVWANEINATIEQEANKLFNTDNAHVNSNIVTNNKYSYVPLYSDVPKNEKDLTVTVNIPQTYSNDCVDKLYKLIVIARKQNVNHFLIHFNGDTSLILGNNLIYEISNQNDILNAIISY